MLGGWRHRLTDLRIPQSIEIIRNRALYRSAIRSLTIPAALCVWSDESFYGMSADEVHFYCNPQMAVHISNQSGWGYWWKPRPLIILHYPETDLERLPGEFRSALINSFLKLWQSGSAPSEEDSAPIRKYIRRHAVSIWREQKSALQEFILREQLLDERSYRAIQKEGMEELKDNPDLQAAFLEYRSRLSAEKMNQMEQQQQKRKMQELFRTGQTAGEVRKLWRCRERDGTLEILAYRGMERTETVVVPGKIGTKPVTTVHAFALGDDPLWRDHLEARMKERKRKYDRDNMPYRSWIAHTILEYDENPLVRSTIRRIIVQEGVRALEVEAFAACGNLEAIRLPDSLERIGERCFYDCRFLEDLILPEGLKEIGEDALLDCRSLRILVVLGRETRIGITTTEGIGGGKPLIVGYNGPVKQWATGLGLSFADLELPWDQLLPQQRVFLSDLATRIRDRGEDLPGPLRTQMEGISKDTPAKNG